LPLTKEKAGIAGFFSLRCHRFGGSMLI